MAEPAQSRRLGCHRRLPALLEHWRHHKFVGSQPFFCQIEAVETIIWLTEVASRRAASKGLLDQIAKANEEANPELFRLAMKMATGSGKTTVMAMLIAWQAVNAARKDSKNFSRAFLIVTPGITIKDRLRVLLPSEPDNYYETREIAPPEMLPEVRRAEIVITNYHAFQHRETLALPKVARSFLQGNDPEPLKTTETDAEMLDRACGKLLNYDRVNIINDEAHHCYRHKVGADAEGALTGDDKKEAAENEEAARLWINGIEALDRKLSKGVRAVYDLSATPFFLRGSGYPEGYLFPWVVSDFSLMDAIESGIVKLPRVPVSDNLVGVDTVVYRDLWKHIGKDLPKTAAGAAKLSAFDLPPMLRTGLTTLYSHYAGEFERWERGDWRAAGLHRGLPKHRHLEARVRVDRRLRARRRRGGRACGLPCRPSRAVPQLRRSGRTPRPPAPGSSAFGGSRTRRSRGDR